MTDKRELKYRAVAFQSESTEGTDPTGGTPSTFYRVLGTGHAINPKRTFLPDESVGGTHERPANQSIGSHNDVAFQMYLFGKESSAGDPAQQADLLKACGFKETITASTSAAYELTTFHTTANAPTMTVYERRWHTDAEYRQTIASAVRGNAMLTFEMEKYALIDFQEGIGGYQETGSSTTAGSPPAFGGYNGGKSPLKVVSMTATFDATARKIKKLDVATAWGVIQDKDSNGSTSHRQTELVRTDPPAGSLDSSDIDLFEDVLTAQSTDATVTVQIVLTDGTDTITVDMDIQFGQYNRTGGDIGAFSYPFTVVGNITVTFT